ncbi:DEAD/DEAH box helicase [Alicyclobacillus curvatus]|nr:DEAD/DEAH box helicase [Alicyclobacillus curvatus]
MNRFTDASSSSDVGVKAEVEIDVQFLDTGDFFFSGINAEGHQMGGLRLSFLLFTRFAENFYGTMSRFDFFDGKPGVLLSPREALKYFQGAYYNSMVTIDWPDDIEMIRETATFLQRVLETGRFAPDFMEWQKGRMGWKITGEATTELERLGPGSGARNHIAANGVMSDRRFAVAWLNGTVKQLLSEDKAIQTALADVQRTSPLLQMQTAERRGKESPAGAVQDDHLAFADGDEQDWLAEIGWMEHPVPFRVCLELREPVFFSSGHESMEPVSFDAASFDNRWALNIVLQDKQDATRLFYYYPQDHPQDGHQDDVQRRDGPLDQGLLDDAPLGEGPLDEGLLDQGPLDDGLLQDSLIGERPPSPWLIHKTWLENKIAAMIKLVPWLSRQERGPSRGHGVRDDIEHGVRDDTHHDVPDDIEHDVRQWLTTDAAWRFLAEDGLTLAEAGFTLLLPTWWEKVQRAKSRVKIRVAPSAGSEAKPLFGIDQTIDFDWQIAVGDIQLSEADYRKLVAAKTRLVRLQGQWVQVSPQFLAAAKKALQQLERKHGLTFRDVLEMYLLGLPIEHDTGQPAQGDGAGQFDAGETGGAGHTDGEGRVDATGQMGVDEHAGGADEGQDAGHVDAEANVSVPIEIELNTHLTHLIAQLQQMDTDVLPAPSGFVGELRPYQVRGFSWLSFLYRLGLGAVLADDMGLGKTVQYIAYLLQTRGLRGDAEAGAGAGVNVGVDAGAERGAEGPDVGVGANVSGDARAVAERAAGGVNVGVDADAGPASDRDRNTPGPALLICPTSVLGNWQKELARFAPGLQTYVHYGTSRRHGEEFVAACAEAHLVLTTYTLAQIDELDIHSVSWDSVCLDEAQNIKNAHAKQSMAIRKLSARHRVAMTGTPMENRLTELWSIFDFINPGYLGGLTAFTRRFVTPVEKNGDGQLLRQLRRLVQPFMLRRLKTDKAIELDLPEKTESKVFVQLTAEQAALYESVLADLLTRIEAADPMQRRGLILSTLTRLKQVCNHPALAVKEDIVDASGRAASQNKGEQRTRLRAGGRGDLARSAKLERFVEMVQELRAEGDTCLVFTQFVETGKLLVDVLQTELGEDVLFLHGGTSKKQRDEMIASFSGEDGRYGVFVLSLKAGGVGLNLTAANHVFHFDRWWNPAVENQATDRAYRIGQRQHVNVYKFVALGTVEERIDELISRKQAQSEEILGAGEQWITELSTDELHELFALRREWVG